MAEADVLHNEEGGEEEEDVEMTAAEVLDKLEEVRSFCITVCQLLCIVCVCVEPNFRYANYSTLLISRFIKGSTTPKYG